MAASLRIKAQDVIYMYCDLCISSPVEMYCNVCATNLCKGCVGEHISTDPTKDHNVVMYNMRYTKPIFPICSTHKGAICEMHCRQCAKPICVKCIASRSHKKHHVTDLMELCNAQKNIIEKKTEELEKSYLIYESEICDTENQMTKVPENHEKLMASITDQGDKWHKEIDTVIYRLKTEAERMKNDSIENIQIHLLELKNLLSQIHQAILDNKYLLQSNNVANIIDYNDKTQQFEQHPRADASPAFSPFKINSEDLYQMFGSLTTVPLSETSSHAKLRMFSLPWKQRLLASTKLCRDIESGYDSLVWDVACDGDEEVWVCGFGSGELRHFNNLGILDKTITTKTGNTPYSIAVTQQGDLIYNDTDKGIFMVKNGKHEKMLTVQDWKMRKLCYTDTGDLLISMLKDKETPQKVVRYKGSKEKQVIQFDQEGNPWFSAGDNCSIFINENRNGDLCASDFEAKQVLAINKAGKLRFRYTGNICHNKYTSFYPRGVVTDSKGNILIADKDNNCIHIISDVGRFIHYIDNCQLSQPFVLSLDKNNTLFVGEFDTNKVRVIKYLA